MKATGIVRRIDDLGRVVIPRELRRNLRIKEGDPLEIYTGDGGVLFRKYNPNITVKSALDDLKEILRDEDDLNSKPELLKKINEMEALLKAEQDEFDGRNQK